MSFTADNAGNPAMPLKWYRKLATRKGRMEGGVFLAEGDRVINQIAEANPNVILEILSTQPLATGYLRYSSRHITENQLGYISSTRTPQGTIAVVRLPMDSYSDELPPETSSAVLLLEDIQDPGNLGSLIRTAAAFDFDGVILSEKCADPFSPKVVQSAAGTLLSLWIRRTADYMKLAKKLKNKGFSLVAADLDGAEDSQPLKQQKLLLALGNEAAGLSQALLESSDYRLRIPIADEKAQSLNVAASGAILMYMSHRRR